MDTRATTRQGLHAVAELLLAGHQYRVARTIRLAIVAGGFRTGPLPGDPTSLAVRGTRLVVARGERTESLELAGTVGSLASAAGLACGAPAGVYVVTSGATCSDELTIDPGAAAEIARAFEWGDAALRALGGEHAAATEPVLWPEHFDVGITLGEVNYGVSAGDAAIPEPYAYVGPWEQRRGSFWDQPFGAARPVAGLAGLPGAQSLLAFFEAGRAAAAVDPVLS